MLICGSLAGAAAGGLLRSGRVGAADDSNSRRIALTNLHTSEHLEIEYFRGGYLNDALVKVQHLLRDVGTGEAHAIDPHLMDYLCQVAAKCGKEARFGVITGFRSQHGLHMQGRAIDVRMAGIDCAELAAHATSLQCGGVGYYRASDFVHMDTGAFRTWRG